MKSNTTVSTDFSLSGTMMSFFVVISIGTVTIFGLGKLKPLFSNFVMNVFLLGCFLLKNSVPQHSFVYSNHARIASNMNLGHPAFQRSTASLNKALSSLENRMPLSWRYNGKSRGFSLEFSLGTRFSLDLLF